MENTLTEELPEVLLPEVFQDIKETYWYCLASIPDPRREKTRVYPLKFILHRIISGFVGGNKFIGVLFPTKRQHVIEGKNELGALPTRKVVYKLLRRIDWEKANVALAPLWEKLGYTPNLVVRREFRNPKVILEEFHEEERLAEQEKQKRLFEEQKKKERTEGMSAAKAKQPSIPKTVERVELKKQEGQKGEKKHEDSKLFSPAAPIVSHHDLLIDGKVVKASYNSGVKERIVHVTEVKRDENDRKSRYIIGSHETVLDRNGEWGAALSILDALIPQIGDRVIMVSGDAGFCVEEFCRWLNEKDFFLHLPDKRKRR